ncbi:MAG TPA: class I tRNA ligase family protein, partial [Acidothermaceae bacterium]|nr:class I tRNA ligase family protein [Acidothermaceae bacterium]
MTLRLYDTASRQTREFESIEPGRVSLYLCGATVQAPPHIGHVRSAVVFDVACRWLSASGYRVTFCRNVTDIDDKIIARARAEGRTEAEVAGQFEREWWAAMDGLGVQRPTHAPHATEWVDQMVALIADLLASGHAYETEDGAYLSVESVEGYGLLKHQSIESLRAGARVEVDEHKRSPVDFAL